MESFQREMGRFSLVAFVVDVENLLINNHQKKISYYRLFIEVNDRGRFDFIAAFNPY